MQGKTTYKHAFDRSLQMEFHQRQQTSPSSTHSKATNKPNQSCTYKESPIERQGFRNLHVVITNTSTVDCRHLTTIRTRQQAGHRLLYRKAGHNSKAKSYHEADITTHAAHRPTQQTLHHDKEQTPCRPITIFASSSLRPSEPRLTLPTASRRLRACLEHRGAGTKKQNIETDWRRRWMWLLIADAGAYC
ncbi:hypothetical protein LTS10_011011 [Elasticomyces elasticus]|nr:hypothetical protein LTS10_011011 [Elasticomyces elasticus]